MQKVYAQEQAIRNIDEFMQLINREWANFCQGYYQKNRTNSQRERKIAN